MSFPGSVRYDLSLLNGTVPGDAQHSYGKRLQQPPWASDLGYP